MDWDAMKSELERDEGRERHLYRDTVGKESIGIGRNLADKGVSEAEIDLMFKTDCNEVTVDLGRNCPWWTTMPETAQRGLFNMAFNMGWPTLSGFKNMLAALERGDYVTAAAEALDSKWATQVGRRADRVAEQFRQAAGASSAPATS